MVKSDNEIERIKDLANQDYEIGFRLKLDNEDSPIEYEESQRIFWYIINIKILISVKQNKTYFLRQIISNLLSDLSDLSDPKKTKSIWIL